MTHKFVTRTRGTVKYLVPKWQRRSKLWQKPPLLLHQPNSSLLSLHPNKTKSSIQHQQYPTTQIGVGDSSWRHREIKKLSADSKRIRPPYPQWPFPTACWHQARKKSPPTHAFYTGKSEIKVNNKLLHHPGFMAKDPSVISNHGKHWECQKGEISLRTAKVGKQD